MLINQLPINKLTEHDESIITFINDVVAQRLKKFEDTYIDMGAYIRPFPA